jgi:hypothetical protein
LNESDGLGNTRHDLFLKVEVVQTGGVFVGRGIRVPTVRGFPASMTWSGECYKTFGPEDLTRMTDHAKKIAGLDEFSGGKVGAEVRV